MSEQRSISRNIAGTFLVQIPNYIFGIIAGVFLTRQLGPESKGVHTLFITNTQLLVMFLGLNLTGAIQFFSAGKKINDGVLLAFSGFVVTVGALILFVLLFTMNVFDSFLLENNYDTFFFRMYLFVSFILTNINTILSGFLQGNHQFKYVNNVSLVNSILNLIVFSVLYFISGTFNLDITLHEVLVLTFIILTVNFVLLFYFFQSKTKPVYTFKFKFRDVKPLMRFIIPAYFSVLINFFNYRLMIWMVNHYEGNENLGYFSLALNLAQMMLMVTLAINTVLFPYFASRDDSEEVIKDFMLTLKVILLMMLLGCSILVFIAPFLIPLLYGDIFEPSVLPVQVLCIGTCFCALTQVFGHFFGAKNKNWINTVIYTFALVILYISGEILIPKLGIEGAAWASNASYFFMLLLFFIVFRLHYKIPINELITIKSNDWVRFKSFIKK